MVVGYHHFWKHPYNSLIFTFCELRNVVSFAIFGGPFTRLRRRVLAQEASFRFTLVRVPRTHETKGPSKRPREIKIGVFNALDARVDFANFQHGVGMEHGGIAD